MRVDVVGEVVGDGVGTRTGVVVGVGRARLTLGSHVRACVAVLAGWLLAAVSFDWMFVLVDIPQLAAIKTTLVIKAAHVLSLIALYRRMEVCGRQ